MKRVLQTYRDGKSRKTPLTTYLLDGEQGNMQTLEAMASIVRHDRTQPDLRQFVLREIVKDARGHDSRTEVQRIFEYARDRITYRKDPFGVERVADIWSTLYVLDNEGDCGIKSTFIATCCALLGHKPYFVVIKQREKQTSFNHVYNMIVIDGSPVYLDATPEYAPFGWQTNAVIRKLYPIF